MSWIELVDELPQRKNRNPIYNAVIDEFISSNADVARIKIEDSEVLQRVRWETIVLAIRNVLKRRMISDRYKLGVRRFNDTINLYLYKIS